MTDLIVRPTGMPAPRDYMLQLREAHCGGTDYETIAYISEQTAREIVDAGAPYWLHGDPALRQSPSANAVREFTQTVRSLSSIEAWWAEVLRAGTIGERGWPDAIAMDDLLTLYRAGIPSDSAKWSAKVFYDQFPRLVPGAAIIKILAGKGTSNCRRTNGLMLPTLDDCRKHFAEKFSDTAAEESLAP